MKQPILIHMRGEKVLRVTISLINGHLYVHLGLMDPTHGFTPAEGGKAFTGFRLFHWTRRAAMQRLGRYPRSKLGG